MINIALICNDLYYLYVPFPGLVTQNKNAPVAAGARW